MKYLVAGLGLACVLFSYFLYQGFRSAKQLPVSVAGGSIPLCGAKPNCVCSLQDPADSHFIEAIVLGGQGAAQVAEVIESIGGKINANDGTTLQATFTSSLFRFVDDLTVQIDGGKLHVRSSSRVGYSDLGANRKRIERLRRALL